MKTGSKFLMIFFLSQANTSNAQMKDYKVYQDTIFNICLIESDSISVSKSIHQIYTLDTASFTTNKHLLYRDLGFLYYKLYALKQDSQFLKTAIYHHEKAIQYLPDFTLALEDLMVFQFFNKDYKASMQYYQTLKSISRPRKDTRQLYRIAKKKSHA